MSGRWPTKPLAVACDIRPSKSEASARLSGKDLVSFLPMEDLGIDQKMVVAKQTKRLSEVNGSYTYFADGDVLLAKITPCFENGKLGVAANLVNGVGFGSSEYIVLRPRPGLHPEWLYYLLSQEAFREKGELRMGGAVGHKRVAKEFVESFPIPLPPISEQERIVRLLDEGFAGIATAKANAEKNFQNAHALFESDLQNLLTMRGKDWLRAPIGDVIRFIDYRGKTPVKTATGIRLITAKNVKMGYLSPTPTEFIAATNYKTWMTRGIPKKGDILFTTEAPLANVAQLDTDEKVAFAQRIIIMQPDTSRLDSSFLKYLLLSRPVQDRIRAKGTGATVQGIKASLLKLIEISFPASRTKQKELVARLDALARETRRLEDVYQRKCAALEQLKAAVLHRAFAGGL